jgi:hypothetical protein
MAQNILATAALSRTGQKRRPSRIKRRVFSLRVEQFAELIHWLIEEQVSYAVACERLLVHFNLQISQAGISDLWSEYISPRLLKIPVPSVRGVTIEIHPPRSEEQPIRIVIIGPYVTAPIVEQVTPAVL